MPLAVYFLQSSLSALMQKFMYRFTSRVQYLKMNFIIYWRLFTKSFKNFSWLVLPRKIRKMSVRNLSQKKTAGKFLFAWRTIKTLPYGGVTLVFTGVPAKWMKYILHNERNSMRVFQQEIV